MGLAGLGTVEATAAELVFVSWGGSYQDAIRKAWIEPFTRETGVKVIEDTNPEIAKIKAMVDTKTVSWDVITGGGATLMQGVAGGLFEPLDGVDLSKSYPEAARYKYGAPSEIFSSVLAFSKKAFPDGKPQPRTWADFFDVKKFPGKRTVYDRPQSVLEAALLADGVDRKDVYRVLSTPDGLERAMKKVEELKPHVVQWWRSGAQPVQLLGSGDAVMALGWNGRFQTGIDEGLPIQMEWDGAIAQLGFFMVVKGAKNRDSAMKFLNYMVSPKAQAEFYKYVAYGPTTPEAWKLIPKERWALLPSSPDNLGKSLFLDIAWWDKNNTAVMERYQALIQK
jgi:putative spermidine/putrescine transport system substrate-binding protein